MSLPSQHHPPPSPSSLVTATPISITMNQSCLFLIFRYEENALLCLASSSQRKVLRDDLCVCVCVCVCVRACKHAFMSVSVCNNSLFKSQALGLPGGPVAKTPRSQCRESRLEPSSGNQIPHTALKIENARVASKTWYSQMNIKKTTKVSITPQLAKRATYRVFIYPTFLLQGRALMWLNWSSQ